MKQYEEIQKKILDLMKGRKDVTIFAIIEDKESVSAMQDGCSPYFLEPLAAYLCATDSLEELLDMLNDETLDKILTLANKRFFRPSIDTSNVECFKCKLFKEQSNHFGCCEHKETPFDGEESNKTISGCPTGCPFFEQ